MEGNKNAYTSVINDLHPPVITRHVRLIPVTRLSTTVCMRVELYGCPWDGGTHAHTHTHTLLITVCGYYSMFTPQSEKATRNMRGIRQILFNCRATKLNHAKNF